MIDWKKTVFLVDGKTEELSFKAKFAKEFQCNPKFRIVRCNGRDVTTEGYIRAAYGTLIIALHSSFLHIVCILDREQRKETAKVLVDQIKNMLVDKISQGSKFNKTELNQKIQVFVPDIMFENWIVADIEGIKENRELIKESAKQEQFDGKSGAKILDENMNVPYKKLLHAPKLFKSISFGRAKINSPSFHPFSEIFD